MLEIHVISIMGKGEITDMEEMKKFIRFDLYETIDGLTNQTLINADLSVDERRELVQKLNELGEHIQNMFV